VTGKAGKPSKAAALQAQIRTHLEQLARLTDKARIAEEMQLYLESAARFHRYSLHNVLVIQAQCPHATWVAGYRKWQQMGFQVQRGEKGIGILAPQPYRREVEGSDGSPIPDPGTGKPRVETGVWFRTVYVFDATQVGIPCLSCGAMASHDAARCGECGAGLDASLPRPPRWTTEGEAGEGLAVRLESYAQSLGIEVVEGELPGERQGESHRGKIVLREGLSPLGRASVLAHEVAHEVMHAAHERLVLPRAVRETEAEGVAYVVCAHFGYRTNAPNYVALWSDDSGLLQQRMARIADTARQIVEAVEAREEPGHTLELPTEVPAVEVAAR
jgi:antirestriction protein ArdC